MGKQQIGRGGIVKEGDELSDETSTKALWPAGGNNDQWTTNEGEAQFHRSTMLRNVGGIRLHQVIISTPINSPNNTHNVSIITEHPQTMERCAWNNNEESEAKFFLHCKSRRRRTNTRHKWIREGERRKLSMYLMVYNSVTVLCSELRQEKEAFTFFSSLSLSFLRFCSLSRHNNNNDC